MVEIDIIKLGLTRLKSYWFCILFGVGKFHDLWLRMKLNAALTAIDSGALVFWGGCFNGFVRLLYFDYVMYLFVVVCLHYIFRCPQMPSV